MNGKAWGIFIIVVVAILGGLAYLSSQGRISISDISTDAAHRALAADERNGDIDDRLLGKKDAKVVIVEYGDYQCPGCGTIAPRVKAIAEKHKDNVALIFRNYPVPGHSSARPAAAIAEAAGLQGKFWDMHSLLFAKQREWSGAQPKERNDLFIGYAKQLGLNTDQLLKDAGSDRITKKINFDSAIGRLHSVSVTPTIIVNGTKVEDLNEVEVAVERALAATGVPKQPTAEEATEKPTE